MGGCIRYESVGLSQRSFFELWGKGASDIISHGSGARHESLLHRSKQKRKAVTTYRKTKLYVASIRQLGYPSRRVLFDWVKEFRSTGRPKERTYASTKLEMVGKTILGQGFEMANAWTVSWEN